MNYRTGRVAAVVASGKGRPFGLAVLALCLALQVLSPSQVTMIRNTLFDGFQALFPPERGSRPATVVEIDEKSLRALGQWPWPRSLMARLLMAVQDAGPMVIGLDVLMPEPDRSSPDVMALSAELPPDLKERLARLPSHDRLLAGAISAGPAPVVMGVAGLPAGMSGGSTGPMPPVRLRGEFIVPGTALYDALLRSRPELDRAAAGHGLLSVERDADGVVRRLPLVAWVGGRPFPSLAVEMVRQAAGIPAIEVTVGRDGVRELAVGRVHPPVSTDGTVWLHFGRGQVVRSLSALDVLEGKADVGLLRDHLVLIGVTGLGLAAQQATPVEASSPAVEIHAQLLDALLEGELLQRPSWALAVETATLLVLGLALVFALPSLLARGHWLPVAGGLLPLPASALMFREYGLLLDGAVPLLGAVLVYMAMAAALAVDGERQRLGLQSALEDHRLRMAHMGGELAAERRAAEDRLHFIDMISHEYRTPLSVLRTGLDVLELRLHDTTHVKSLWRMRRAVVRLTEIVDVGLARARLEVAQIPLERTDTKLGACLAEAVSACRAAYPTRTIHLSVPEPAPVISADGPMLKTALLNLIDNALKYSDDDFPVAVHLGWDEGDAGSCQIAVTDQGIGMSKAETARVFEKFYRAPKAMAKQGTGMGLGITRRIIELHGGRIDLASSPGEGTTATIFLPLTPLV
ncbi:MAG: CHASE2 and HATPase_c domain-containing protein [Magnetospirillum sp.]|nr:CHASE2 and HATPase_c domain-containing protein [Magnetospirillum sp.]